MRFIGKIQRKLSIWTDFLNNNDVEYSVDIVCTMSSRFVDNFTLLAIVDNIKVMHIGCEHRVMHFSTCYQHMTTMTEEGTV